MPTIENTAKKLPEKPAAVKNYRLNVFAKILIGNPEIFVSDIRNLSAVRKLNHQGVAEMRHLQKLNNFHFCCLNHHIFVLDAQNKNRPDNNFRFGTKMPSMKKVVVRQKALEILTKFPLTRCLPNFWIPSVIPRVRF